MGRALDPKKIKSAQRVLEVLEFFNAERQQGTVMDIARAYGYPQSSTSELLGCLVALGYLHRDLRARTYWPSARVAVLGSWVQPELFRRGGVLPLMDELAETTGATVVLAGRQGLSVQYVQVVDPAGSASGLAAGDSDLLLHSAPGHSLLTTCDSDHVRKMVHRLNAESGESLRVRPDAVLDDLNAVRTRGYALGSGKGAPMISVLLSRPDAVEQLALCLHAPRPVLEASEAQFVQVLRAAVARHSRRSIAEDLASPGGGERPNPAVREVFRRVG